MEELTKLFQPGQIGKLKIKNRIVMAAMGTGYCHPEGYVTPEYTAYLAARAEGGAGLIITSVTRIVDGVGMRQGSMSIHHDKFIPALTQMVEVIKSHGARIFLQLHHPGTRGSEQLPLGTVVAPSAIPHLRTGVIPKELSVKEIEELIENYGKAARRAKQAGFDGVEVHCGHGYLLCQFLSPRYNQRTDEYGGSVINRARLPCEVTKRVRKTLGPDFPIIVRVIGDDYVDGGITIDATVQQAPMLVEAGADAVSVSAGSHEALQWTTPLYSEPLGCFTHLAAAVKQVVKVPVIAVGRLGEPDLAERTLREGKADFIAMGRPLLADPDLPNKAKSGRLADICRCISCGKCIGEDGRNQCTVNPVLGQELVYRVQPAPVKKRVVVVGGGLAGMEAAALLAQRGHEVSLYERADRLGGQWNIGACLTPYFGTTTDYLSRKLDQAGVRVTLNTQVNARFLQQAKPDAVVVATGTTQILPDIPGADGKNVVMANDVLTGEVEVGEEVIIIGGRLVGLDTALFLARLGLDTALFLAKRGKKVSIVSRRQIARDIGRSLKMTILDELVKHGVYFFPESIPESVTDRGLNIIYDGQLLSLRADTIVIATGSRSDDKLARELTELAPELEVHVIGDCVRPRDALEAIREGFRVGNEL